MDWSLGEKSNVIIIKTTSYSVFKQMSQLVVSRKAWDQQMLFDGGTDGKINDVKTVSAKGHKFVSYF